MVLHHPGMIYANLHVPDPGIRFFVRLSGFSKSTYLESTCYGEFPDAKNFPEKFCPGSGFALNGSFLNVMRNFCELSEREYYSLFRLVKTRFTCEKASCLDFKNPMLERVKN